jgi:integrase
MSPQRAQRRSVGLIRARGRGIWQIAATTGYDAQGRRRRSWQTARGTKLEAERALARLVAGGGVEASGRTTLDDYLMEQWLPQVRPRLRTRTVEGYEGVIRRYIRPHLGGVPLRGLSPVVIERWVRKLRTDGGPNGKLSERTILQAFRVLREACRAGVRWRVLDRDPTDAVQAPRLARYQATVVGSVQARSILQAFAGHDLEPAVALALGAGLRRGEILGLRWATVDLEAGALRVERTLQESRAGLVFGEPKTENSRRVVTLPPWTTGTLREHRKRQLERRLLLGEAWLDNDLVIEHGDGHPMHPESCSRRFRGRLAAAGLPPIRFHDLRHAHATVLLADGVPLKVISERLGHSSIGVTGDLYAHVTAELAGEAARRLDVLLGPGA